MDQADGSVPVEMRRVYRRLEQWRRTRVAKTPIPEPLWTAAAHLAQAHGVCRTAQVLHLEYKKLKQLTQATTTRRHAPAPAAFMELVAPPPAFAAEYLIELEGPRGKVRIQWKGSPAPDLAGLSRALWESA